MTITTNPNFDMGTVGFKSETLMEEAMKRRMFLLNSIVAGSLSSRTAPHAMATNDRLRIGLMGCGGRCKQLLEGLLPRKDCEIVTLCDVDRSKFGPVVAMVENTTGNVPDRVTDFRRMLDDPTLDAVVIAVNSHWHSLATILACQAGKHVYVEKPFSQNIWEGRKVVEAAHKYQRVVQIGMQNRSHDYLYKAADFIRDGGLGQVHQVRVINMLGWAGPFKPKNNRGVPEGLNYDIMCGPGPIVPWNGKWPLRHTWDFGPGNIWDNAIHQTDIARWITGLGAPKAAHCSGGVFAQKDGREIPDTFVATWEYDDVLFHLQASQNAPYKSSSLGTGIGTTDEMPDWLFSGVSLEVYGTDGMMFCGRHGGGWTVHGPDGGLKRSVPGRHDTPAHIANFIEAVRDGVQQNVTPEEAQISTVMAHMANISYRLGGRRLEWDSANERFYNDSEANALLKRTYRNPWIVPDSV
jgi:predicted dehydrogenase